MPPIRREATHAPPTAPYNTEKVYGVVPGPNYYNRVGVDHQVGCLLLEPQHAGSMALGAQYARCRCPRTAAINEIQPVDLALNPEAHVEPQRMTSRGLWIPPRPEPTPEILAGAIPRQIIAEKSLQDILDVILASDLTENGNRIVLAAMRVRHGQYATYQEIADYLFLPKLNGKQQVRTNLRKCKLPDSVVPYHRIIASVGFNEPPVFGEHLPHLATEERQQALMDEGVRFSDKTGKVLGTAFRSFVGSVTWYKDRDIVVC